MKTATAVRCFGVSLHLLPVVTRMPLKFGPETVTSATVARVRMRVRDRAGRTAVGWGETPLSVTWVWPGTLPFSERFEAMREFALILARAWAGFDVFGHPLEVGWDFQEQALGGLLRDFNAKRVGSEPMPWLAALVICSVFDQALHDAFGNLHGVPIYSTYTDEWLSRDLAAFYSGDETSEFPFAGLYPDHFLQKPTTTRLKAWHLVGGVDPISPLELKGTEPRDGYPVLLEDWIRHDGLTCLKIKLRGNEAGWDLERMIRVGEMAVRCGVEWLTADFNCTVQEPEYVNRILDQLRDEHPRIYGMLLYVEQPFPYDLERYAIRTNSVSARKPLFLDESAHDWRLVRLGRDLGWTGVALKTCKTQSGAILSACWAKAHGMGLMVQDLTNPMLAQIPHVLLAAHVGTIMGVETNAMQFYPEASLPEAAVHPGLYRRESGCVDWGTLKGSGFGYRLEEIRRELPGPVCVEGE